MVQGHFNDSSNAAELPYKRLDNDVFLERSVYGFVVYISCFPLFGNIL